VKAQGQAVPGTDSGREVSRRNYNVDKDVRRLRGVGKYTCDDEKMSDKKKTGIITLTAIHQTARCARMYQIRILCEGVSPTGEAMNKVCGAST
jgi:hypothetical protein